MDEAEAFRRLTQRAYRRGEVPVGPRGVLADLARHGIAARGLVEEAVEGRVYDALVCSRYNAWESLIFPDNVVGICEHCFCAIQFRPGTPAIRRLCGPCAVSLLAPECSDA